MRIEKTAQNAIFIKSIVSVISLVFTFFSANLLAQSTSQSSQTPGAPAGAYSLNDLETVNLFSGNLNFNLPLTGAIGRGAASHGLSLTLETQWGVQTWEDFSGNTIGEFNSTVAESPISFVGTIVSEGGWTPLTQEGSCDPNPHTVIYWNEHRFNFTYTEPNGTQHMLLDPTYHGKPYRTCGSTNLPYGRVFESTDGSFLTFVTDADVWTSNYSITGYLTDKSGLKSRIENGLVLWTQDRNGNRLEYSYSPNPHDLNNPL